MPESEHPSDDLSGADRELESALGSLAPASVGFTLDDVAYRRGRADATRMLRVWRVAAGLALAAFVIALWWRPASTVSPEPVAPEVIVRVVEVPVPANGPERPPAAADAAVEYLAARDRVIRTGPLGLVLRPGGHRTGGPGRGGSPAAIPTTHLRGRGLMSIDLLDDQGDAL